MLLTTAGWQVVPRSILSAAYLSTPAVTRVARVRHGRVHQELGSDRIRIELATLTRSISYLTRISARYDYNNLPTCVFIINPGL